MMKFTYNACVYFCTILSYIGISRVQSNIYIKYRMIKIKFQIINVIKINYEKLYLVYSLVIYV